MLLAAIQNMKFKRDQSLILSTLEVQLRWQYYVTRDYGVEERYKLGIVSYCIYHLKIWILCMPPALSTSSQTGRADSSTNKKVSFATLLVAVLQCFCGAADSNGPNWPENLLVDISPLRRPMEESQSLLHFGVHCHCATWRWYFNIYVIEQIRCLAYVSYLSVKLA